MKDFSTMDMVSGVFGTMFSCLPVSSTIRAEMDKETQHTDFLQ